MALIRYADFRQYEKRRIIVNDSMMALLAGSQLAAHTLLLTEGSAHTLADLFPNVQHIRRFNMKPDVARQILQGAESYLGAMAVPYTLGLHEDYMKGCLEFLVEIGAMSRSEVSDLKSANIHEGFESKAGAPFEASALEIFHLLRRMRNCQIHSGGKADSSLINYINQLGARSIAAWKRFAHDTLPVFDLNDDVVFRQKELGATLAVTRMLAEAANGILAGVYPRDKWADKLVADWATEHSQETVNRELIFRKVQSFARINYRALALTNAEIGEALERADFRPWPREW
jgi:hypothetical protein